MKLYFSYSEFIWICCASGVPEFCQLGIYRGDMFPWLQQNPECCEPLDVEIFQKLERSEANYIFPTPTKFGFGVLVVILEFCQLGDIGVIYFPGSSKIRNVANHQRWKYFRSCKGQNGLIFFPYQLNPDLVCQQCFGILPTWGYRGNIFPGCQRFPECRESLDVEIFQKLERSESNNIFPIPNLFEFGVLV